MKQKSGFVWLGIVICFAAGSCGISELDVQKKDDANGVWVGPSMDVSPSVRSVTYFSVFDYPDGYDWRSDPERGEIKCSLVVYKDEFPVLKVPVGNDYNVSPDPDMHRIIQGHLYTDFSTSSQTIIKRDGKPLFSYPESEMICDLAVNGENVHTIGHSRSGQGFSYRINGEVVIERETGYTFERLTIEDSTISFAFAEPISSAEGTIERYYIMCNGKVSQVALRDDIKKVWDVAHYKGQVYYLATLTGVAAPVIVSEQGKSALTMPSSMSLVSCRMNLTSDGICVEGVLSDKKQVQCVLWGTNRQYQLFPKGMIFSALCLGDDGVHCTMNPTTGTAAGLIYRAGETITLPSGYSCRSRSAMDFASGMLTVGLSSSAEGRAALWVDGQIKSLDANGYISVVEIIVL